MDKDFNWMIKMCKFKVAYIGFAFLLFFMQSSYSVAQQTTEAEEHLRRLNEAIKVSSGGGTATTATLRPPQQTQGQENVSIRNPPAPTFTPPLATSIGQNQTQVPINSRAQSQVQQNVTNQTQSQTGAEPVPANISQEAFIETTNSVLPMTPEQIRSLHALFDESQRAASESPGVPPLPTSTAVQVRLEPGATPPIVRLSSGIVSSLVFVDSTGAPWPIKAYSIGNPKAFNIAWEPKSNLLLIQSLTVSKAGNLAVVLKGFNTPIMVTLMSGQRAVDYRVDLRVPGLGPNAKPIIEGLPGVESPYLLDVLNGVPPPGSRKLVLPNCISCELWVLNNLFYLRTRFTLLSPAWISKISSPDGTQAYELNQTPVLLLSEHGKVFTLYVEGL